jgi:hypothetical protein
MAKPHIYTTQIEYEKSVIENAKYFTAFLYGGPFNRKKIKRKTYQGIIRAATQLAKGADRPVMLYAVSNIHECHIGNVKEDTK